MLAGVARALVSRGGPRVAARQFRTSQPLRTSKSPPRTTTELAFEQSVPLARAHTSE